MFVHVPLEPRDVWKILIETKGRRRKGWARSFWLWELAVLVLFEHCDLRGLGLQRLPLSGFDRVIVSSGLARPENGKQQHASRAASVDPSTPSDEAHSSELEARSRPMIMRQMLVSCSVELGRIGSMSRSNKARHRSNNAAHSAPQRGPCRSLLHEPSGNWVRL